MNNNIDYELLAKYFSGECSEDEKRNVKNWLAENPDNQEEFDSLKKLWLGAGEEFEPSDINKLWSELAQKAGITQQTEKNRFIRFRYEGNKVMRYAAVILFVCLISVSVYLITEQGGTSQDIDYKLLSVEAGEQSSITLGDGTKITLDSGSELYYPEEFVSLTRKVKLHGEAYFEVEPDKEKPFEVETGNALITVLGTKFNIRKWNDNQPAQVKVAEGKVSLSQKNNTTNHVVLEKGFGAELHADGTITTPYSINIETTLSWLKGEMYLEDVSVAEVIAQVERWYDVKINLSDKTIAEERITIYINKKSLERNLELLTQLIHSKYEISGREITIH